MQIAGHLKPLFISGRVIRKYNTPNPAIKNADKVPIFAISAITLIGTNPAIKETKIQPPMVTQYGV